MIGGSRKIQGHDRGANRRRAEEAGKKNGLYSLIIISFTVEFAVSGVTSPRQEDAADRTLQTGFVPRVIHDAHDVTIRDRLTTADTDLDPADLSIDLAHDH